MSNKDLLNLIEQKRLELIKVAMKNGLASSIAVRYSQELDHLLNEYQQKYSQKVLSH
ncbi:aspartyl-phosphate phosphatase Spo0E family protein [Bacillus sp. S/N-304-OC-R1]|uniref:aspartyl-phosphate phosphatase Spo0E family protein n=1 Tax=Bacillus sp. S/N-304-OC-R1 TaxID=2758034 RepID=UPI001C8DB80E|nr:aspartyl-phosphate phosphatase Spo0E family protein [Bacillus sp. S/N-304-OC-R1]MBY0120587.1 aspartyl-phosphate phosphatase Spo0E family protein [Bacillus sp. S/N-304-OC-R1]